MLQRAKSEMQPNNRDTPIHPLSYNPFASPLLPFASPKLGQIYMYACARLFALRWFDTLTSSLPPNGHMYVHVDLAYSHDSCLLELPSNPCLRKGINLTVSPIPRAVIYTSPTGPHPAQTMCLFQFCQPIHILRMPCTRAPE